MEGCLAATSPPPHKRIAARLAASMRGSRTSSARKGARAAMELPRRFAQPLVLPIECRVAECCTDAAML